MNAISESSKAHRIVARAETLIEQIDRDEALCRFALIRAISNAVRGYRGCPVNACRRARRCCGPSPQPCSATMKRIPFSYDQQVRALDDIRQALRAHRRTHKTREAG